MSNEDGYDNDIYNDDDADNDDDGIDRVCEEEWLLT
jgi:hypothetical protein